MWPEHEIARLHHEETLRRAERGRLGAAVRRLGRGRPGPAAAADVTARPRAATTRTASPHPMISRKA
jgi:hypothetical protein